MNSAPVFLLKQIICVNVNIMNVRENIRPGGRSARVQESVHKAVCALTAEVGRGEVTVPMIAARAGVTPATIYRRWGELPEHRAAVGMESRRHGVGEKGGEERGRK